jgi:hypothetical protein
LDTKTPTLVKKKKKPKKLNIEFSNEWTFKRVSHVNAEKRVTIHLFNK